MKLLNLLILVLIFSLFLLLYSRLNYREVDLGTELRLLEHSCNMSECEVNFGVVNHDKVGKDFDFFIIFTKEGKKYKTDSGRIILSPNESTILNRTFALDPSNPFESGNWKYEVHFYVNFLNTKIGVELYERV